jgi:hypothetical protein
MCQQLEIKKKIFDLFRVQLDRTPRVISTNDVFIVLQQFFAAESIKNKLKRVQKLYKTQIAPKPFSFSSKPIIVIWFF